MDPINNLQHSFLSLLRLSLGHPAGTIDGVFDWESIYDLADKQGLSVVVLDGVQVLMDRGGGDGSGVIGIDSNPSYPEEVPGIWRGCDGPDGFRGPVCAGCGGRDPISGNHAALLRA